MLRVVDHFSLWPTGCLATLGSSWAIPAKRVNVSHNAALLIRPRGRLPGAHCHLLISTGFADNLVQEVIRGLSNDNILFVLQRCVQGILV